MKTARRTFVIHSAFGLSALVSATKVLAMAGPVTDEKDPKAEALGYRNDAAKVDTAKFPKRAGEAGAKQFCHNCALYGADADSASGPCSIFQNKLVAGNGWCNAWVAKS